MIQFHPQLLFLPLEATRVVGKRERFRGNPWRWGYSQIIQVYRMIIGFSMINHPYWGSPMTMEPPFSWWLQIKKLLNLWKTLFCCQKTCRESVVGDSSSWKYGLKCWLWSPLEIPGLVNSMETALMSFLGVSHEYHRFIDSKDLLPVPSKVQKSVRSVVAMPLG